MDDFDSPDGDEYDDPDEGNVHSPNFELLDRAQEILAAVVEETGGQQREGQQQLLAAAVEAVKAGRPLEGLAPTATGKSYVVLLTAILSGLRTVVATATNHLQDQYIGDLEVLSEVLERRFDIRFTWAVLKGQSHYLCNLKLKDARAKAAQGELKIGHDSVVGDLKLLGPWLRATETGDIAEVNVDLSPERRDRALSVLTLRQGECLGRKECPEAEGCFLLAARRKAYQADITIVPTALLMSHVASGGKILRPYELVVLDEAHKVWEIAANNLGGTGEIGGNRIIDLARRVKQAVPTHGASADRLHTLGEMVGEFLKGRQQMADRGDDEAISVRGGIGGIRSDGQPRHPELARLVMELAELGETLTQAVLLAPRTGGPLAEMVRAQAAKLLERLLADLAAMWTVYPGEVVWITNARLKKATVKVAEQLWTDGWDKGRIVVLAVSATIPDHMGERLGMWTPARDPATHVEVASPLPTDNLRLFIPAQAPDASASRKEWITYVASTMEDLTIAMGGRALLLFTSNDVMWAVAKRLRYSLAEASAGRLRVLVQGDMTKRQLVREKQQDPTSVLLATAGFFEGINLPGPCCRLVAVDKTPFPARTDPLFEAMREYFGKGFHTVDLPHAATMLQQGLGRLQRTIYDDGLLAVLDARLGPNGKGYRQYFNHRLPWEQIHELSDAVEFIRSLPPVIDPAPAEPEVEGDDLDDRGTVAPFDSARRRHSFRRTPNRQKRYAG